MNEVENQPDANQEEPRPVAYDAEGKPLYAAPPPVEPTPLRDSHVHSAASHYEGHNFDPRMRVQYANEPDVVHRARQHEPDIRPISEELHKLHQASQRQFPNLNLSEGEFVIHSITRHPIGLVMPVATTIIGVTILLGGLIAYPMIAMMPDGTVPYLANVTVIALCLMILVGIYGYLAVWVYLRNTFYLTNESIIQEIQHSVFSKHEQTVSLGSVEDASFRQVGIMQTTLNYGTIRLSTEGEETTYRFYYVENPKAQIAILNNAIEAFKNGRPVVGLHDN